MEVKIDMKGVLKFFPINVRRGSNFFMAGQHNSLFVLSKWAKSYLTSLPSPRKAKSAQSEEGNSPWSEDHSHPLLSRESETSLGLGRASTTGPAASTAAAGSGISRLLPHQTGFGLNCHPWQTEREAESWRHSN